jgi:hypothetical protein
MEQALTRCSGGRLSPLYARLIILFISAGVSCADGQLHPLTPAQAFVLTHAMAGVLRALNASDDAPPLQEVENALVRLVLGYFSTASTTPHQPTT